MSGVMSSKRKSSEPVDMNSALAALEAEIGTLSAAIPSTSTVVPANTATMPSSSSTAAAAVSSSSTTTKSKTKAPSIYSRMIISEPERRLEPVVPSVSAVAAHTPTFPNQAATEIPAPHSYSNAYGAEMKQHYNELQSQAKQFQVQRSSGQYGKIRKKIVRKAAGREWVDESLSEWPENDFRLFCGDLGKEVSDEMLKKAFGKFPSFAMAKVVRHKRTNQTRGYGFVSFLDPNDYADAFREFNGKYIGNRPLKLRKSKWKDRNL